MKKIIQYYRVCHRFRLTKQADYFQVNFDHFWIEHPFIRQLGQYWKSARAYNQTTICNFSLPKTVQRSVELRFFLIDLHQSY